MNNTIFRRHRSSLSIMLALASLSGVQVAHAGSGWGDSFDPANNAIKVPTYYANSPSGPLPIEDCFSTTPPAAGAFDSSTVAQPSAVTDTSNALCDTGHALRKFVDAVPALAPATPDTTTYPGSDYYEIAVVDYSQKMHSDLAKATTLRGYVQVVSNASDASKGITASGATYTVPQDIAGTQSITVTAVGTPSYLGPVISATHGRPVRIKFYNLLPAGTAGDLKLPVDETITGAGLGPDGVTKYGKNRAEVHLHGGDNPWISDGTPHQWILPAIDELTLSGNKNPETASMARGVGAKNVPDMPNPGPGAMTYYYPNGLSGRLMFYHDHSLGITRLNVYAGMAAGYIISDIDGTGEHLAGLPTDQQVLVIQDKTFVPKNIAMQDAKWDTTIGQEGDLWYPHVYETNQDPNSFDGTNGPGRWDWGSWFWPVFASTYDLPTGDMKAIETHAPTVSAIPLSNVSTTPEAYMDTPIVNGMAYPTLTVDPKPYRFRILNASNDRFMNLGLYLAADKNTTDAVNPLDPTKAPIVCDGISAHTPNTTDSNGNPAFQLPDGTITTLVPTAKDCTEVKMVSFDASYVAPKTPYTADGYPNGFPTTGGVTDSGWGMQVGGMFPQGAPDPATAGPHIVQVGNEAGLLAAPLDIPSTPLNYEYNKRSVTVLNVQERGLYMGPAERVDTVIDFTNYAGQTLILYNDAPAPNPASDPRIDYFTGEGDNTGVGGSPNTLPGYGPNTRTVMQIVVSGKPTAVQPIAPGTKSQIVKDLETNLPKAYADVQAMPVVPQPEYANAFPGIASITPTTAARNNSRIYTGTVYLNKYAGVTFTAPEAITYLPAPTAVNYPTAPTYSCNSTTTCAAAVALQQKTPLAPTTTPASTVATQGNGLVTSPAGATVSAYVQSKAIQELFDPAYGRMNATLGVELPFTSALTQTTIPLGYVDPITETVAEGETQFWKITHNGVDAHPVHFHLVNVQVINRIGWDGTVKAPHGDEFGWKETVKMNPLEDIVVAVRAKKPVLRGNTADVEGKTIIPTNAFGLPTSSRRMDPSQAVGSNVGFTQVNPVDGTPTTVTNLDKVDYGWEYVWHCHILGHEENDFMRPVKFMVTETAPIAPTVSTISVNGTSNVLTWTDNATNEYKYMVERALVTSGKIGTYGADLASVVPAASQLIGNAPLANATTFTDSTAPVLAPPAATANPTLTTSTITTTSVKLNWPKVTTNVANYTVERAIGSGATTGFAPVTTVAQSANNAALTFTDTGLTAGTGYTYRVTANPTTPTSQAYAYRVSAAGAGGNGVGNVVQTTAVNGANGVATINATTTVAPLVAPVLTIPTAAATLNSLTLNWTETSTVDSFQIFQGTTQVATVLGTVNTYTVSGLNSNTTYPFYVMAVKAGTTSVQSKNVNGKTLTPITVTAPSGLAATVTGATVTLKWTDNSNNESNFAIYRSADAGTSYTLVTTVPTNTKTYADTNLAVGSYQYYVIANDTAVTPNVASAQSNTASASIVAAPVAPTLSGSMVLSGTKDNATLSWTTNNTPASLTGLTLQYSTDSTFATGVTTKTLATSATSSSVTGLNRGTVGTTTYYFRLVATGAGGSTTSGTYSLATK